MLGMQTRRQGTCGLAASASPRQLSHVGPRLCRAAARYIHPTASNRSVIMQCWTRLVWRAGRWRVLEITMRSGLKGAGAPPTSAAQLSGPTGRRLGQVGLLLRWPAAPGAASNPSASVANRARSGSAWASSAARGAAGSGSRPRCQAQRSSTGRTRPSPCCMRDTSLLAPPACNCAARSGCACRGARLLVHKAGRAVVAGAWLGALQRRRGPQAELCLWHAVRPSGADVRLRRHRCATSCGRARARCIARPHSGAAGAQRRALHGRCHLQTPPHLCLLGRRDSTGASGVAGGVGCLQARLRPWLPAITRSSGGGPGRGVRKPCGDLPASPRHRGAPQRCARHSTTSPPWLSALK